MSVDLEDDDKNLEEERSVSREARQFHTRDEAQAAVLVMLRGGALLTKREYERAVGDGSRLAPIVEQLRNAHGFSIKGHGTLDKPYELEDKLQLPTLARVTPDMQRAYYETDHWLETREKRFELDGYKCRVSFSEEDLRCHHLSYANLFREPMTDLLTVCEQIHDKIHRSCRLKFPSGLVPHLAELIGWGGFERWLLP